jgi:hypothetical protein
MANVRCTEPLARSRWSNIAFRVGGPAPGGAASTTSTLNRAFVDSSFRRSRVISPIGLLVIAKCSDAVNQTSMSIAVSSSTPAVALKRLAISDARCAFLSR